jgi:hypothetical protein
MQDNPQYFWYSFSLDGANQGIVITKDDAEIKGTEESGAKGLKKLNELGLVPKHDHCRAFSVEEPENGLEVDRLYSPEEMRDMEYASTKDTEIPDRRGYE